MATKVCTKCGIEKEATTEFFSKDKRLKSGLLNQCKACNKTYMREYMRKYNDSEHRAYMSKYMREYSKTDKYIKRRKHWDKEYGIYKRMALTNSIVKRALVVQGFPKEIITPELIELKMLMIKQHRIIYNTQNTNL